MGAAEVTGPDPRHPEGAPETPDPIAAPVPEPKAGAAPQGDRDPAADLPPVESIGPETDLAPWLKPGVPAALKNAALRRKWLSLPAIRDYVDPALDYAWDWNAAAPVPGAAGRVAQAAAERMVEALAGPRPEAAPRPDAADRAAPAAAPAAQDAPGEAAAAQVESPPRGPAPAATAPTAPPPAAPAVQPEARRRHGGAAPVPAAAPATDKGRSA